MAEQLKTFFSVALVERLGAELKQAAPSFPSPAFVRQASRGLDALELVDRARHIARALGDHLPADYQKAVKILLRSLGPEHASDELIGAGMTPFFYLPHTLFVAERGLDDFETSLHAQYELTKRFSAEGSIRAFIEKDPERTFSQLRIWAADKNPHVRRLVSEGTRLRLPWAQRVSWLDENPHRVLELLELLKSDPTTLVRRSVANSLNDLSKLHPELTVETCASWLKRPSPEMTALVKHALRTLIKKGHRGALTLLGVGAAPRVSVSEFVVKPKSLKLGGAVRFSFEVTSTLGKAQDLAVDYVVHFVKANGKTSPKVFKLKRLSLAGKAVVTLEGQISLANMTTRKHYPGVHRLEALINGVPFPLGEFRVRE